MYEQDHGECMKNRRVLQSVLFASDHPWDDTHREEETHDEESQHS